SEHKQNTWVRIGGEMNFVRTMTGLRRPPASMAGTLNAIGSILEKTIRLNMAHACAETANKALIRALME
ncbi:MAG: hypothetical protein AAFU82_07285, partial [Pseudomonadota bacterium]